MITVDPAALAFEIAGVIEGAKPRPQDVIEVRRQLLARKGPLGLANRAAPEYVAECLFRCLVIDHLQRRFSLTLEELPRCINSSHRAGRGVCRVPLRHRHNRISDTDWVEGWCRLQCEHPEVNVDGARRADLYVIARGAVVSVEFKYAGQNGVRDIRGCAAQVQRYADQHAATLLAIYDAASNGAGVRAANQLRGLLGPAVPVVIVSGPSIPPR